MRSNSKKMLLITHAYNSLRMHTRVIDYTGVQFRVAIMYKLLGKHTVLLTNRIS